MPRRHGLSRIDIVKNIRAWQEDQLSKQPLRGLDPVRLRWPFERVNVEPEAMRERPLRVGTYNTAMLSDFWRAWEDGSYFDALLGAVQGAVDDVTGGISAWLLGHTEENQRRAELMVQRVLDSPYDVVVLNEVFDEDCRRTFVDGLGPTFPYVVDKLGPVETTVLAPEWEWVPRPLALEDSGLMVFSRWPFVQPDPPHPPVYWSFKPYTDYASYDMWACKGAGAVTVRHPIGRVCIGFSHLQASYDGGPLEHADVRLRQLADLGMVVDTHATSTDATLRVVCGDLNVQGATALETAEWSALFGPGAGGPMASMADTWWWDGPRQAPGDASGTHLSDDGVTHLSGQRLDYVLSGPHGGGASRGRRLAAHHALRAVNLLVDGDLAPTAFAGGGKDARGGSSNQSDHFGLDVVLNRWSPRCCPQDAVPVPGAGPAVEEIDSEVPGGMQWVHVSEPGCVWVKADTDAPSEVTVFAEGDLSVPQRTLTSPYAQANEDLAARLGQRFVATTPMYVRVRPVEDVEALGRGVLRVTRPDGAEPLLAVVVPPFMEQAFTFPGSPINAEDAAWFELPLNRLTTGGPQGVAVAVDSPAPVGGPPSYEAWVEAADGQVLAKADAGPDHLELALETGPEAQSLFLRVRRLHTAAAPLTVRWTTDVTLVGGLDAFGGTQQHQVVCTDETEADWMGSDEVQLRVEADGVGGQALDYDADTGTARGLSGYSFRTGATVTVAEVGDGSGSTSWSLTPSAGLIIEPHSESHDLDGGDYRLDWAQVSWVPAWKGNG